MGGWEVLIALFGGAWYVVSAIAASKEKKKKQAERRAAMSEESTSLKPDSKQPEMSQTSDVSLREKSDLLSQLKPAASKEPSARSLTLRTGGDDPGMMRQARKAILESMRKELGLPSSKPSAQKVPPRPSAKRLPKGPPALVGQPGGLVVPVLSAPKPPPIALHGPQIDSERLSQRSVHRSPYKGGVPGATEQQRLLTGKSLQALLQSHSGLKQAIVMAEVLQPPVSLRNQHLAS